MSAIWTIRLTVNHIRNSFQYKSAYAIIYETQCLVYHWQIYLIRNLENLVKIISLSNTNHFISIV